ncbi:MAG: hypothetical protein PHC92_09615 [Syntrophomonadaceae bacterium]|nr:hypothetical protein [Syntrophomonadaceae bacterium]
MKVKGKLVLALMLVLCIFAMTACGGGGEEVAAAEWPEQFSEVPAFTASAIENLEVIDESTTSMQFQNVTEEQMEAYSNELLDAGFVYEGTNGNVYTKVVGDESLAVGWNVDGTAIELFLMTAPAEDGPTEVVAQWPAELDGITPLQGVSPNQATMNPDGLVTVDYSDVTEELIAAYREALAADGFEPYELESGVEAYARVDEEGMSYLVLLNPQDDVEGHFQLSGIISPAE